MAKKNFTLSMLIEFNKNRKSLKDKGNVMCGL